MWYAGIYNSATSSVWYAESQNGFNWNTIGSLPVLTKGNAGSWDAYAVNVSAVVKYGGLYKMYYVGRQTYTGDLSTGLALSTDGIHWEKIINPIIGVVPGYNNFGLTEIIKKDSIYYGYYSFTSNSNSGKIGVAISADGSTWIKQIDYDATLTWENGNIGYSSVIYDGGIFKMIYGTVSGSSFGYATSADGIHFTKQSNPIFTKANTYNGQNSIWYPNYRKINNVSYLYYTGKNTYEECFICVARNFGN